MDILCEKMEKVKTERAIEKNTVVILHDEDINSKKRFIIDNKDLLGSKQRLSIRRIINNEHKHIVQESCEGSYIPLNKVNNETINLIYNIVKSVT